MCIIIGIYQSLKKLEFDSAIGNRHNVLRPENNVARNNLIL